MLILLLFFLFVIIIVIYFIGDKMLKIITGRAGSGKTTKIINEIINRLQEENDTHNILLFVPEQMSHQAEYEIAKRLKGKAFNRLQVLSFKRLAYRIFQETGGQNKIFISDISVLMVITKIIEENRNRFLLYNRLGANYSFVELVKEAIKELKSFAWNNELMEELINREELDETLRKKIHDLQIIYQELIKVYGNKLIDEEDFYYNLALKIKESEYIKNTDIYIDGYHNFTTIELNVIYEMLKYSHSVTMLFTLDNPTTIDMSSPMHLFNLPYKTFMKIKNYALDNNIPIEITHLSITYRYQNPELTYLEKNYEHDTSTNMEVRAINIYETENPESLVHTVARMIFNDVYQNQAKYSDYVIYLNNQEIYYPLIKNIFPLYDIPVFIDDKKMMLDHFLLNFIDSALEVIKNNMSYEAMFRMIKTEMFMPIEYNNEKLTDKNYKRFCNEYRNRIDILENYCLSHGISGKDWEKDYFAYDIFKKISDLKSRKTKKEEELEKIINDTKQEVMTPLSKFKQDFTKGLTIKEKVIAIYNLVQEVNTEYKLDILEKVQSSYNKNEQDLNEAKKHKQVYNHLMNLFDELVQVCGDYKINTNDFIKVLRNGFKGMRFAIVPPAIDQVMVGTLKRSRFQLTGHFDDPKALGVKKAIVLGVNENEIPKVVSEKGLITDKERELLLSLNVELLPTVEANLLEEYFIIYTVLTSPSEKLILTYTLADNDKKEAYRSEIIDKVVNIFPKLHIETCYDFPLPNENNFYYVTTKTITAKLILKAVNSLRKGQEVNDLWKALYGYYKHSKSLTKRLLGVTYTNEALTLDKEMVKELYSENIIASISSIESYNHCPYAHFLERGLHLQPRDIQKMEVVDIGDLYHETIRAISKMLIDNKQNLHEIPLSELEHLINQVVDTYAKKVQRQFFMNNKKNQYLLSKIKDTLIESFKAMHYQSKYSQFKIFAVEEMFSSNAERLIVEPIKLDNGFVMSLKGFIDRIDVAQDENNVYIKILDYKSGNREIDFNKIYHGLSLQLLTYLDVVLENSLRLFKKLAIPAGILYYRIQESEIKADMELDIDKIREKHLEQYKMNGYTTADKNISALFDQKLKENPTSDIIKVAYKNDGNYNAYSKVLTVKEINALRKYTRQVIVNSMKEITNGHIPIKPVLYNKIRQCEYCNYHAICKFDPTLKENSYNEIKKTGDSKEIIDKIVCEYGGEE